MVLVPLQIVEEAGSGAGGQGTVGAEPGHSCAGTASSCSNQNTNTFCFVLLYCFVLLNKKLFFTLSLCCITLYYTKVS